MIATTSTVEKNAAMNGPWKLAALTPAGGSARYGAPVVPPVICSCLSEPDWTRMPIACVPVGTLKVLLLLALAPRITWPRLTCGDDTVGVVVRPGVGAMSTP